MAVLTYSPKDVTVSLSGLLDISGFVDGTFIELEKDVAPYTSQYSADGETGRTFRNSKNFTVKLTLAQSSESNNILNALHALDLATQLGKVPLLIRDGSGTTNFFTPTAWIQNYPAVVFSNQIEARVWTLSCAEGILLVGGNEKQNAVLDILGLSPVAAEFLGG